MILSACSSLLSILIAATAHFFAFASAGFTLARSS